MAGRASNPKSGRQKGTPNKKTTEVQEILARLGCNPIEGMAKIALGDVVCEYCGGKKKAKFSKNAQNRWVFDPMNGELMNCMACSATGKAVVPLKLKAEMHAELAGYVHPKRKAVEVVDPGERGSCTLEELLASYRTVETSTNVH